MVRRHVVISGTGRAGTTFLVELMTHLELQTGFTLAELAERKDARARAGLEKDILDDDCPYIVKSPSFCDVAEQVLAMKHITIEHVIIPMRDVRAAAESRRFVTDSVASEWSLLERAMAIVRRRRVRGGLWHTAKGHEQEVVLLQQLYNLTLALSGTMIPVTLLRYPRLVKDATYLFDKLRPILGDVREDRFRAAFEKTANPGLVHSFSQADR